MLFCAHPRLPPARATCCARRSPRCSTRTSRCRCGTALGRDVTLDGLFADGLQGGLPRPRRAQEPAARPRRARTPTGVYPVDPVPQGVQPPRRGAGPGPRRRHRRRQLGGRRRPRRAAPEGRRERDDLLPAHARRDAGLRRGDRGRARGGHHARDAGLAGPDPHHETARLAGIECIRNALGDVDASGRRRAGADCRAASSRVPLDTLIVAIGEGSGTDAICRRRDGRIEVDRPRHGHGRPGDPRHQPAGRVRRRRRGDRPEHRRRRDRRRQEGGGDDRPLPARRAARRAVTARRCRASTSSRRRSRAGADERGAGSSRRALPVAWRRRRTSRRWRWRCPPEEARREARRCLRCDLEFTQAQAERELVARREEERHDHAHHQRPARSRSRRARTLLEAAQFLGFPIPTLCHMEGLSPYGACRLCVVEIGEGPRAQARLLLHLPGRGGTQGAHRLGAGGAGAAR